uniref:CASP-like protein n=1 Tax=Ananas comosus var. bracteatus TaxID=296719 RepID=A0A6V7NVR9_ANACO|nr:unnamed protein product [Ananas comosus var. bracteatus]
MRGGVGVSPGNVPVYFYGGGKVKLVERRVKVAEVVLRCLICGLGVIAAALVGTDSQVRRIFSLEKRARFTDMKALVFLVIANGMMRGSVLLNKPLAWAIFSCDQMMAYVALAAVAAAAESAVLGQFGQAELQWMKICNLYSKFCTRVGEGIVSAFLVSISMVTISCISAFNLFRLYGPNKGKTAAAGDLS